MKREDFKFQIPNGLTLQGHAWRTEKNSIGTLVGVHGYSEYSLRYLRFAEFYLNEGYDVFWLDLPGHGESEGVRSDIDCFNTYVESLEAFLKVIETKLRNSDLKLFGHSLGGLVCIRFLQSSKLASKFSKVGLSSPLLGLPNHSRYTLPFLKMATYFLPNLTLSGDGAMGADILTHDKEIMQERLADPLIKPCVKIRWVKEFLKAREKAFCEADKIKVPMGFYLAGDDRVVSRTESERFFEFVKAPKLLKVYESWYHEISNEIEREIFFKNLLEWYQQK